MKNVVIITPNKMCEGVLALIRELTPDDIAELQRASTQLACISGIGRALEYVASVAASTSPPVEPAPDYDALPSRLSGAPSVIDYRSPVGETDGPAPAPEIPERTAEREPDEAPPENGNRLPIVRTCPAGDANRMRLVRLLVRHGPMSQSEIATALDLGKSLVSWYLKGRPAWFVRVEPDDVRSAWTLTDEARRVAEAPCDGDEPRPEPRAQPEPEPEPGPAPKIDPAPPAVDPDDPKVIAREQTRAIARAILDAKAKLTRARIAAATGLEEAVVKNRLRSCGPNVSLPAFHYFTRSDTGEEVVWGLTPNGASLAREGA